MTTIFPYLTGFHHVSRYRRYGLALAITAGAVVTSRAASAQSSWAIFALLLVAIALSAFLAGRGPGLLSAFFALLAMQFGFAPDGISGGSLRFVVWMIIAFGIALSVAQFRSAQLRRRRQREMMPLPLWEENLPFEQIMQNINYTLVDRTRCYILYQLARQTSQIPGEVAEVGVYKGGTAKLLAKTLPQRQVHLFDTFSGMPRTNATIDAHAEGDFADTSLPDVQDHLRDCPNVHFYQGLFPLTAGPVEGAKFSLVHVDADIYESVRACCHFFYPRMESDSVMVFDDYGFPSCPGARKAVDEFFLDKPEIPFYLPTGQCIVVRK